MTQIKYLALWTGLWVISVAVSTFGPLFAWEGNTPLTLAAITISLAIGWGMVRADILHFLSQDEMQQRIALEAMGMTLGLTVIVGIAYSQLDTNNIIPWNADINGLFLFMGPCYIVNLLLARKRYS